MSGTQGKRSPTRTERVKVVVQQTASKVPTYSPSQEALPVVVLLVAAVTVRIAGTGKLGRAWEAIWR